MKYREQVQERVITANLPNGMAETATGILARSRFEVLDAQTHPEFMDHILHSEFRLILLGVPFGDERVEDTLHAIRKEGMPCRHSSVILVARGEKSAQYQTLVGRGANAVIHEREDPHVLESEIARLSQIAPRIDSRLLTKLKVDLRSRDAAFYCQTINVSISGVLLSTSVRYPIGTNLAFEFSLPGSQRLIRGEARIVRYADESKESAQGMALKFLSFDMGSYDRLKAYIDRKSH